MSVSDVVISGCGYQAVNGTFTVTPGTHPIYQHTANPKFCLIRGAGNDAQSSGWIITEHEGIHLYMNEENSAEIPQSNWICIAGLEPAPAIEIENTEEEKEQDEELTLYTVWNRYESMALDKHVKTVEYFRENGHCEPDIRWVMTEKIHGANFALISDGVDVIAASRSQVLDESSSFFGGWREILAANRDLIVQIHERVVQIVKTQFVIVFGEMFGGGYDHPDVQKTHNFARVQKGMSYASDILFYAFDIQTDVNFLDYEVSRQICNEVGLLFADPIGEGSFDEVVAFDVENFMTVIPERLGLPPLPTPNVAEGIVLRRATGGHVLMKKKAAKFDEFLLQVERSSKKQKSSKKGAVSGEEVAAVMGVEFVSFVENCMNQVRLEAAISKIGAVTKKTFGTILREFTNDVVKDVLEEFPAMDGLGKKPKKLVNKFVNGAAQAFARDQLKALME